MKRFTLTTVIGFTLIIAPPPTTAGAGAWTDHCEQMLTQMRCAALSDGARRTSLLVDSLIHARTCKAGMTDGVLTEMPWYDRMYAEYGGHVLGEWTLNVVPWSVERSHDPMGGVAFWAGSVSARVNTYALQHVEKAAAGKIGVQLFTAMDEAKRRLYQLRGCGCVLPFAAGECKELGK